VEQFKDNQKQEEQPTQQIISPLPLPKISEYHALLVELAYFSGGVRGRNWLLHQVRKKQQYSSKVKGK
jgi:hypothetical protein